MAFPTSLTNAVDGETDALAAQLNNLEAYAISSKSVKKTVSRGIDGDYQCDGVADDVQINQAITAVAAAGGGIVLIKASSTAYDITSAIVIPANSYVRLMGEGRYATRFRLANGSNCNVIEVATAITSADYTHLSDFYIDGNRSNQTDLAGDGLQCGIFTNTQNYVVIKNVVINEVIAQGVYSHDWASRIENVQASNCGWQGIEIDASRYTSVTNCTARYCGSTTVAAQGIDIVGGDVDDQPSNVTVTGCHTYRNFGPGFAARNAKNVIFSACESYEDGTNNGAAYANTRSAFHIADSKYITVIGCHGMYSTASGILLDDANYCVVKGNHFIGNGDYPTSSDDAGIKNAGVYNHIEGNICTDDQGSKQQAWGYYADGAGVNNNTVINNDFSGNVSAVGISLNNGADANSYFDNNGLSDGWGKLIETFTYASATSIGVASGAASRFMKGDKLRFQNNASGTWLYAYIINVADTTLTVVGDAVPNATITNTWVSRATSPIGFPEVFDFTPTLYASTSNPTIGTGATQYGRFSLNGKMCHYVFRLGFGSSMNAGSGTYRVSLPINAGSPGGLNLDRSYGTGFLYDATGSQRVALLRIVSDQFADRLFDMFTVNDYASVTEAAPFAWAQNDEIAGEIIYEI